MRLQPLQPLQTNIMGVPPLWPWKRERAADGDDAFPVHDWLTPEQEQIWKAECENEILREERA